MKMILRLFLEDLKCFKGNVIAVIVFVGLVLIPPLYAWFNLLAFWSPYEHTGNIQVAVANDDAGYESTLIPTPINAGEDVVSALRGNDQFDWIFTTKDEAIEGVKSGAYYAAIVIPKTFSADLMSAFGDKIKHAEIEYYTNQKENAVAPRLTQEGADDLQVEIDKTFTKTVSEVALNTSNNLVSFMNGDGIANYAGQLDTQLGEIIDELSAASAETEAFSALVESTSSLVAATASILGDTGSTSENVGPLLSQAGSGITEGTDAINGVVNLVNQAFSQASGALDSVGAAIDNALDALSATPADAEAVLNDVSSDIGKIITSYEQIRSAIEQIDPQSPVIARLDSAIAELQSLQTTIGNAISDIQNGASQAETARTQITEKIDAAKASIDSLHAEVNSTLENQADQLDSQLQNVSSTVTTLTDQIDATEASLSSTSSSLSKNLTDVQSALQSTSAVLSATNERLSDARTELQNALASGDLDKVRSIIGNNPDNIAQFLSSPTQLVRHPVFKMDNNGSAMSAFYTSLTLWIGAIFMVALMEADVSRRRREQLVRAEGEKPATPTQLYLGRFGMFWLIGFLQSTIVVLGNVFFLGVQCEHFFLYLLAAWVAALVFDSIVYTLTVSFGKVGEAIAIVGLVLQIAGSGGIFPVVMSAPLFQVIYPWLPFSHSMIAFESCVAGIYGDQYWIAIGMLLLLLIPAVILGVVLRRPVIKLNDMVVEKLEETKLL